MSSLRDEMYSDHGGLRAAEDTLWTASRNLVEKHWLAIKSHATAVWNKPWTDRLPEKERDWSHATAEKWMSGAEVVDLLMPLGIHALVVEESVSRYLPPPQAHHRCPFARPGSRA